MRSSTFFLLTCLFFLSGCDTKAVVRPGDNYDAFRSTYKEALIYSTLGKCVLDNGETRLVVVKDDYASITTVKIVQTVQTP